MKRLELGGRIDRSHPIKVSFDGTQLSAFEGDTLASALLASNRRVVGRSFKYHRPRGVFSAGVEEPNAMVHLRDGTRVEPNARATLVEAYDGLNSTSQNAWPSLSFDIGSVNDLMSPFFSAGFYYKTFVGPFKGTKFWMQCERFIRQAAGMGRATLEPDPDCYEKRVDFCDVLIIGGGAAGLSAALAAGRAGAKVILAEQDFELGGAILNEPVGSEADFWLASMRTELAGLSNVTLMTRTTVFGAYDGDTYGLVQRLADHVLAPAAHQPRQRYIQLHAKRAVMATGALERPLVFAGNDRPGVMLAGAARSYLNRFAVLPGQRIVLFTNNNSVYELATYLVTAGAKVSVVDLRPTIAPDLMKKMSAAGVDVKLQHGVLAAKGRKRVTGAAIVPVDAAGHATGPAQHAECDLIAISGGWTPALHLWSQMYGKPEYDLESGVFLASDSEERHLRPAGIAHGLGTKAVESGFALGAIQARATGATSDTGSSPAEIPVLPYDCNNAWACLTKDGKSAGKAFIDFQHDVKLSDIDQAHLEGYTSVEHLKRYTTTGMATDQGKLANMNALARMAELRRAGIPETGTTTFRPPYTPVTIGAIVGTEHGAHIRPTRLTPLQDWHEDNGAVMTEAGLWKRAWYYPQGNEDVDAAYRREAKHVREKLGLVDVSTLGKIAIQGPDAAEFLNRIYTNGWKTLKVGRIRYGVMLREDGIVWDDGATARLGKHDYFMTTTTANAGPILAELERKLQTCWRNMRVQVTSLTDQFAAMALAGPLSRRLLQDLCPETDFSAETLPNNHLVYATIADTQVRIHRMSFSGELAYEIYVPSGYAKAVWEKLMEAGATHGIQPYGTESMAALRIEKGHVAGPEIDGRLTMNDLGLGGLASSKKPFVGSVLMNRPELLRDDRPVLCGFKIQGDCGARGGMLIFPKDAEIKGHGQGWITSTTYSPALGSYIAMGLLERGRERQGETVQLVSPMEDLTLQAKVVSHHFYDPEGILQNA
nr:sarcosine oxidase subunit alpha family protein [uncultured Roseovarius sp.]